MCQSSKGNALLSEPLKLNIQGNIYGLTYIDFKTMCVFNGSDLSKEYSAKGILEQLGQKQEPGELKIIQERVNDEKQGNIVRHQHEHQQRQEQNHEKENRKENMLELLLKPQTSDNFMPDQSLQKKKKKKQSRGLHLWPL